MKTLLTLFVLLFPSSVVAEDISDFQIEGISVGDSLLDYMSEEEILSNRPNYVFKNDKFYGVELLNMMPLKTFDGVGFFLKKNDKNYIIYSVYGGLIYEDDIKDCYKKKNNISKEISEMFDSVTITEEVERNHSDDPSGKSKANVIWYNFPDGAIIGIYCVDWSKDLEKSKNVLDHLRITIDSSQYTYWLNNEAY